MARLVLVLVGLDNYGDLEVIKKFIAAFEKHLRLKNLQKKEVEDELRQVKEVVEWDPTVRLFVKRIGMSVPLEAIKEKFGVFGRVMEVDENMNAGLSRSVTITFFARDAVVAALNHPEPVVLNRVALKISAWRPDDEPDPPGAGGAVEYWLPELIANSGQLVPEYWLPELVANSGQLAPEYCLPELNWGSKKKSKNFQKKEVGEELKEVKEVAKRDPSLRLFVQRIGLNVPLEAIKEKFSQFGKVLDVEENLNEGFSRSVCVTYFTRDAVLNALNSTDPISLNRVSLKVAPWRPDGDPEPPGPDGATAGPSSRR
ncbi:hypothetical protein DAPPUDRAFT_102629 [Daphnia pulex]|uniref:RRM domain-containing protein n=1 Tax=Daphnia pulex TaxID=6669 RepID=E9GGY8_DAPPU|nr:hypothetical protein DAPPUDRAFT_102629 [Daphnia pulex]|eukprot:EFX81281.1 hypothetical protein DAPPUDRAFT_102629 [Daphnia pulex]